MSKPTLKEIIPAMIEMNARDLEIIRDTADGLLRKNASHELSTDLDTVDSTNEEGPGLDQWAKQVLEDLEISITLADQGLLSAVILTDGYRQSVFSSRDLNDIVEECGRPRIAHITSAISNLRERAYLTGETKGLQLSSVGRAKARGLIGMLNRRMREAS